jgi:hypothetical protein
MYKFAYFYVRLGYILAGIVFGVSVLFCGGAIVVLEFQKPRQSADQFNFDLKRIQAEIRTQSEAIQQTFGIKPDLPALKRLKERDWRSWSVSLSASERLMAERQTALKDCEELRDAVLAKLEADIGLILGKLAPVITSSQKNSPDFPDLTEVRSDMPAGNEQTMLFSRGADFAERIRECEDAKWTISKILEETKNAENRSALEGAHEEIDRFLEILRNEEAKSATLSQTSIVSASVESSGFQEAQESAPSRKENVRQDLTVVLDDLRSSVTGGWSLRQTIDGTLKDTLRDFEERAILNSQMASAILMNQVAVLGIFLLLLVVAFFIAVGSDLVKAILDSAVWLSNIYSNTLPQQGSEGAGENP